MTALECGCVTEHDAEYDVQRLSAQCAPHELRSFEFEQRLAMVLGAELDEMVRAHAQGRSAKVERIWGKP